MRIHLIAGTVISPMEKSVMQDAIEGRYRHQRLTAYESANAVDVLQKRKKAEACSDEGESDGTNTAEADFGLINAATERCSDTAPMRGLQGIYGCDLRHFSKHGRTAGNG